MRVREDREMSRREALKRGALLGGAGAAAWLLGGSDSLTFGQSTERDLLILGAAALYLEHEAIAAYQAGANSGLLPSEVLPVAVAFMKDHQYHRDGLMGAIQTLGGTPAEAKEHYRFGRLREANHVLELALRLEQGAATAYRTLASSIQNKTVHNFWAHVLADEVRHASVLRNALGLRNY